MWPWEHAIVGYVAYSLFCHAYYRDSPGGLDAFAVVVASVLPDLIDKPLTWEFDVFETGYGLGHSIFFAVPLAVAVGVLARSHGRPRVGVAVAVGYLLHLPADVLDRYVRDDNVVPWIVLWPFRQDEAHLHAYDHSPGLADQFASLLAIYRQELLAGDPSTYILLQLAMVAVAALLWLFDGAPVLRESLLGARRLLEALIDRMTDARKR